MLLVVLPPKRGIGLLQVMGQVLDDALTAGGMRCASCWDVLVELSASRGGLQHSNGREVGRRSMTG